MKGFRGVYDDFVRTCASYPSRVAVREYVNKHFRHYSYSELYGVCEYLSQSLQQSQCTKCVIGILSERNPIIPCIMAAAHKCCTTFMFLDLAIDNTQILEDVQFKRLIVINNVENTLLLPNIRIEKTIKIFNYAISFYYIDNISSKSKKYSNEHSFIASTSGSTGRPKHVEVPWRCIQPNINDLTKLFDICPDDVIYFSTPLTFDPSMVEILLAFVNGASLLIAPENIELLFTKNNNAITFWQTTPSKFFQYSDKEIKMKILNPKSSLKVLALGGEPLNSLNRLKKLKNEGNDTKIFTLYGVTEMSCWACVAELNLEKIDNDKEIPLGDCLSETQLRIEHHGDHKKIGKIMLGSQTRKCSVLNKPLPNANDSTVVWVDTGDLGEVKNETVFYRGRTDDIIKRFGHKINLQAIENTVMQCLLVKACSCVWLPKPRLLVVYFSAETMTSQELGCFLKCRLDDKQWPDRIVRVDNIPINIHGKRMKDKLNLNYQEKFQESSNGLQDAFLKEISLLLCRDFTFNDIKDKDFFSIGGTSFLAISLCNRLMIKYSNLSSAVLPALLSPHCNLGEIFSKLSEDTSNQINLSSKTKIGTKRSRSNNIIPNANIPKKLNHAIKEKCPNIEFIIQWFYNTGKCVDATPTVFANSKNTSVLVGSHSGKLSILDALNGKLVGEINTFSRIEASVLCYLNLLDICGIFGTYRGTVICFNLEDCTLIWKLNLNAMIKSKAVAVNGLLYIGSYDGKVYCIDIVLGHVKEIIPISEKGISADLVLAKNKYILFGTLTGVCGCISTLMNTFIWRGKLNGPIFSNPALYDNDKYVVFAEVNGGIHCRTVEKGIMIWQFNESKGNIFSSMLFNQIDNSNWQIIFGCHDNNLYSISVVNFQPKLHWKTELTGPVYSTPSKINANYILAAANNGRLSIVDPKNGHILYNFQLPGQTFSSPVINNDMIYIGCRDNNIYGIKYTINV